MDCVGDEAGKNDTYGFALAAHPGKSQGAARYTIGLTAHNRIGLPGLRFSRSPKPGSPTLEGAPDALAAAPGPTFIPVHHDSRLD